jgi:hypothetical protein
MISREFLSIMNQIIPRDIILRNDFESDYNRISVSEEKEERKSDGASAS